MIPSQKFMGTYFGKVGHDISSCNGDLACALKLADLNFEVVMENVKDIRGKDIPRTVNVARADTGESLGVNGARYTPTQPRAAFQYLEGMPGKANFRRGGLLKGGRFFLSAEFDTFNAAGETLSAFGVFLSSFDGSWSNRAAWVIGRPACMNICQFMHNSHADGVSKGRGGRAAKHTQNHTLKLDGLLLELTMAQDSSAKIINNLASKPCSRAQFDVMLNEIIPAESKQGETKREEVAAYFTRADLGINGATRWDAFNALSAYDTHADNRRETATSTSHENAFAALISGNGLADVGLPVLMRN